VNIEVLENLVLANDWEVIKLCYACYQPIETSSKNPKHCTRSSSIVGNSVLIKWESKNSLKLIDESPGLKLNVLPLYDPIGVMKRDCPRFKTRMCLKT
jgi:hypothetical protein